ncbi:MAG: hypothetical protein WCK61_00650 [Candidatus Omnitrophota bacterium]
MNKVKSQKSKLKTTTKKFKFYILACGFAFCILNFALNCFAQTSDDLEFNIDLNSPTVPTPKIYKPNIDLSGRGAHRDITWPQTLAAKDALEKLQADLGFAGFYRIQYNLWEIEQLAHDKAAQASLIDNYETIIKKISDSGGTVILNLFGTPSGLGRVLDKNSPPHNLKAYKELVKNTIRKLSCNKKYNIWYEVWNAPDLEDFFLGERSEYLNLYRIVGEAVKELRLEAKIHIPLGGPSVSSWFANIEANNILYPERSLIYELIKYCYSYRLPLDFISWHAYSSDPKLEKQETIYQKSFIKLIREWLKYFNFSSSLPLVIDEWNFDGPANILSERGKDSSVTASFIPAHLKNMYEAGVDYQTYFSLEDFADNKEGVNRNLGIFGFSVERIDSKGHAKASYNTLRMLNLLGNELLPSPSGDDFVGLITTKSADYLAVLIYNYIDPQVALNYLSRNIVYLNSAEKKSVLDIIKSDRIEKILSGELSLLTLRLTPKVKNMFSQAVELNNLSKKFSAENRKIKISFKGTKDLYMLSQYTVDSKCSRDCEFSAGEQKEVDLNQGYLATLELSPYSVQLLVFKKKPPEPVVEVVEVNPDTVKEVVKDAEKP